MNYIISNELNANLKSLVEFLEKDLNAEYCVVGSLALNICGFPIGREPHDIDIEIIKNKKVKTVLEALERSNSISYNSKYPKDPNRFDFKWGEVEVNAWVVDKLEKNFVWKDFIKYATVEDVLKAKLKYGRSKDVKDLMTAFSTLFSYIK